MSSRGRSSFRPRRSRGTFGSRSRGGYSERRHSNFSSSSHYDSISRSRDRVPSFRHKSEMEMTKALVSSVLESGNMDGGRIGSSHRSRGHSQDFGNERKYLKDHDRSMKELRPRSESSRYPKDHSDDFGRSNSKDRYKFVRKSYDDFPAPPIKRQRISSDGSYRESKFKSYRESQSEFKYERFPVKSYSRGRGKPKPDYQRFPIKTSGRLSFNSNERMLPFNRHRSSSREERPSDRRPFDGKPFHGHGGEHVPLICPHCPGYEAMTFNKYRYHLESQSHNNNLSKLIRKHSAVLRKIRLQQRDDQREVEAAMEKEDEEKYRDAEKDFCGFCKLVYKVFSKDSQKDHNQSRFHKMQVKYLRPFCKLCKSHFPSLMVYEHHTASIRHLRSICEKKMAKDHHSDEDESDGNEDIEDLDMSNFVTMDAVGEDDSDSISDNEEITGKLEDVEAAIKENKAAFTESLDESTDLTSSFVDEKDANNSTLDEEEANGSTIDESSKQLDDNSDHEEADRGPDELMIEDYQSDDEHASDEEIVGMEYLCEIEAMMCRLCDVAIRMDYLGPEAIDRHCRTGEHINKYNAVVQNKNIDRADSRASNGIIEKLEENEILDEEEENRSNVNESPEQLVEEEEEDEEEL